MLRRILAGGLGLSVGLLSGNLRAQEWSAPPRTVIAATRPINDVSRPAALGRPTPLAQAQPGLVVPASCTSPSPAPPAYVARAQSPDPFSPFPPPVGLAPPAGAPAAPLSERYNCGMVTAPPSRKPIIDSDNPYLNWIPGVGNPGNGRAPFQSDHAFDGFISPMSNPFLFEDPRALTEARPVFIYQSIPKKNWATSGGNIEYFGVQGRVAFTDRFSVVMNKLGWIFQQPDNQSNGFDSTSGFSEINIGPKWTFLRNDSSGTIGALGMNFEIPVGPLKVYQNTGNLSLDPYLSMGQNFFRSSYGSFNTIGTLGYSFSTTNQRSDHLYLSLHLDYDIANSHKFYPLIEMTWFHYTSDGNSTNFGFEGKDLYNLGSQNVSGHDDISLATGFRYKFSECIQIGTAAEFPVTGRRDLMQFRLLFDVIFRY